MRTLMIPFLAIAIAVASAACGPQAGSLQAANDALGAAQVNSVEFSGSGRWYQFGQAPAPGTPWPPFDVSSYTATVNYAAPAARVQMTRKQVVEPNRVRPAPVEQRPDQYVSGTTAWNLAAPAGAPPNTPPVAQPQPAAVEERVMEIWTTPHGFLKAAAANNATSTESEGGSEVTFTAGKNRYVGTINAQNDLTSVQTWIDNPILGDTEVLITYSDYKDFGGVRFPGRILRVQGGHPVLDLTVSDVKTNSAADIAVPAEANAAPPAITATAEKLADGVWYIKGGSHHSVAIDQKDHIVVVEGPQTEARSLAVIAKVKETIPNKPIKYLVNSHVHFDHSGGLRTFVDEGATIVTHEANKPYYEKAWAAPHTHQPGQARAVEEDGDVRDVHRQARADRRQPSDRDPQDRGRRTQRRVRHGLSAERKDPHRGRCVHAARCERSAAAGGESVRGQSRREHHATQAGREADRGAARAEGCDDGGLEGVHRTAQH